MLQNVYILHGAHYLFEVSLYNYETNHAHYAIRFLCSKTNHAMNRWTILQFGNVKCCCSHFCSGNHILYSLSSVYFLSMRSKVTHVTWKLTYTIFQSFWIGLFDLVIGTAKYLPESILFEESSQRAWYFHGKTCHHLIRCSKGRYTPPISSVTLDMFSPMDSQ